MGLYPDTTIADHKSGERAPGLTKTVSTPGFEIVYVYELVAVIENRTDCFCCSCGDREGSDVACRNHGFAAERPCEKHGMPGQPWGDEFVGSPQRGKMPDSVQEYRRKRAEGSREWN